MSPKAQLELTLFIIACCASFVFVAYAAIVTLVDDAIISVDLFAAILSGTVVLFACVYIPYYLMYSNNNHSSSVPPPSTALSACTPCPLMDDYIGFINQAAQEIYLREKNQPNYTIETNIPTPTFPPLVRDDVNLAIAQQLIQSTATPLWLRSYWDVLVNSINSVVADYIIPQQRAYIQSSILPGVLEHVDNLVSNSECGVTSYADSWVPLTCSGSMCTLNIQSDTGGPVRKLHVDANVTMHKVSSPTLNTNEYAPVCSQSSD